MCHIKIVWQKSYVQHFLFPFSPQDNTILYTQKFLISYSCRFQYIFLHNNPSKYNKTDATEKIAPVLQFPFLCLYNKVHRSDGVFNDKPYKKLFQAPLYDTFPVFKAFTGTQHTVASFIILDYPFLNTLSIKNSCVLSHTKKAAAG